MIFFEFRFKKIFKECELKNLQTRPLFHKIVPIVKFCANKKFSRIHKLRWIEDRKIVQKGFNPDVWDSRESSLLKSKTYPKQCLTDLFLKDPGKRQEATVKSEVRLYATNPGPIFYSFETLKKW